MLIFFDDILVYSPSIEDHVEHLKKVLKVMRTQSLFAKKSKCAFATPKVEYLGHYIEEKGISTDPQKVKAVAEAVESETIERVSRLSRVLSKIR